MKFGEVALSDALGSYLAHASGAKGDRLKKGTLLGPKEIERLTTLGVSHVIVARLDAQDIGEDSAAAQLAHLCADVSLNLGEAATGRVNIYARHDGLFGVDERAINAINRVDSAVTLATLKNYTPIMRGQMVATVKIIPFAVAQFTLTKIAGLFAARSVPILSVSPWRPHRVGLITTVLPSLKTEVIEKTNRVLQARLAVSGSTLVRELRVAHTNAAIASAIADLTSAQHIGDKVDLIIIFGASAVVDPYDVIPQGIRLAGGQVIQVGMPVDPGNLLVLGEIGPVPIIGAPGCARSPKENGFDWVLDRVFAGVTLSPDDFALMGVGGLLMEIETRPRPREAGVLKRVPKLVGMLLAAGSSSRMAGSHKLRALFNGVPLIARSAKALEMALSQSPLVVLGHDARAMAELLPVGTRTIINPDYSEGLSSSLRTGIASLSSDVDGVLVHLADMPGVTPLHLARLCEAFVSSGGRGVVRATNGGKRGNPVILPRSLFRDVARLTGDMGARALIERFAGSVIDVELGEAAGVDVDTQEALTSAGGIQALT